VVGISLVFFFSVIGLCAVVGVVDCFIIVDSSTGGLSSAASVASVTICSGG